MSTNVQFREADATVAFVRSLGLKPSEIAKVGFEKEVRRLRAEAWARSLAKHKMKPLPEGWATKAVREARDSR